MLQAATSKATRIGPKTMAHWPEPYFPATDTGSNFRKILLPCPEDVTVDCQRGIAFVSSQSRPRGDSGRAITPVQNAISGLHIEDSKPEPANLMKDFPDELAPPDGAFHTRGISFWREQKSGAPRLFVINHEKSDPNCVGKERFDQGRGNSGGERVARELKEIEVMKS